jgi:AP-4 complex subunit epsilon-1
MHPNPALLAAAAESVAVLLRSPSHNLKAVGLDALAGVTRLSPKAALEHQVAVIDCLEDPDDTLKLKALELLTTMTKSNNVVVVVDRLLAFLRGCADEHIRGSIATKVAGLAEKYAPDTEWFITVMAEVGAGWWGSRCSLPCRALLPAVNTTSRPLSVSLRHLSCL